MRRPSSTSSLAVSNFLDRARRRTLVSGSPETLNLRTSPSTVSSSSAPGLSSSGQICCSCRPSWTALSSEGDRFRFTTIRSTCDFVKRPLCRSKSAARASTTSESDSVYGNNLIRLTSFNGPQTGSPSWCSDNHRIVFDSRASGSSVIYIEDINERFPREVKTNNFGFSKKRYPRRGQSFNVTGLFRRISESECMWQLSFLSFRGNEACSVGGRIVEW